MEETPVTNERRDPFVSVSCAMEYISFFSMGLEDRLLEKQLRQELCAEHCKDLCVTPCAASGTHSSSLFQGRPCWLQNPSLHCIHSSVCLQRCFLAQQAAWSLQALHGAR